MLYIKEIILYIKDYILKKSALCEHVVNKDHVIDWGNVKILKRESHWHRRRVAEGFLMKLVS